MEQLYLGGGIEPHHAMSGGISENLRFDLEGADLSHLTITESLTTLRRKITTTKNDKERGREQPSGSAPGRAGDHAEAAGETSSRDDVNGSLLFGATRSADSSFVERPRRSEIVASSVPADSPPRQQQPSSRGGLPLRPRQNATTARRAEIAAAVRNAHRPQAGSAAADSGGPEAAAPIRLAPEVLPPWNSNAPDSPFFDPTQDRMRRRKGKGSGNDKDRSLSKERTGGGGNDSTTMSSHNNSISHQAAQTALAMLNNSVASSAASPSIAPAAVNTSASVSVGKPSLVVATTAEGRKRQIERIYSASLASQFLVTNPPQPASSVLNATGKRKAAGKSSKKPNSAVGGSSPADTARGKSKSPSSSPHVSFSASTAFPKENVVRPVSPPRAEPPRSPISLPAGNHATGTRAAPSSSSVSLRQILPPPVPPSLPAGVKITFSRPLAAAATTNNTASVPKPFSATATNATSIGSVSVSADMIRAPYPQPPQPPRFIHGGLGMGMGVGQGGFDLVDLQDHVYHPHHSHHYTHPPPRQQQQQHEQAHHAFSGGAMGAASTLRLSTANNNEETQQPFYAASSSGGGHQQHQQPAVSSSSLLASAVGSTHELKAMLGRLEAAEEAEAEAVTRTVIEKAERRQRRQSQTQQHQQQRQQSSGKGSSEDELGLDVALALNGQAAVLGRATGFSANGHSAVLQSLPLNVLMAMDEEEQEEEDRGQQGRRGAAKQTRGDTNDGEEEEAVAVVAPASKKAAAPPRFVSPLTQPLTYPAEADLRALRSPPQRGLVGWLEAVASAGSTGGSGGGGGGVFVTDAAVQQASSYATAMARAVRVREATMDEAGLSMRAVVADATEGVLRELLGQVGSQLEEALDEVVEALIEAA